MRYFVSTLLFLTVLFLSFGYLHYDNKIEAKIHESVIEQEKYTKLEEDEKDKHLKELEKQKNSSINNRIKYLSAKNEKVNVSVLGSSVTNGFGSLDSSWRVLLDNHLNKMIDDGDINIFNNGYDGYTTSDIIDNDKIEEVVENKPDIIFFEICLINNNGSPKIQPEQTKEDIELIVKKFKKELPDSLVVIQTANPVSVNNKPTGTGYTYDEYNSLVEKFVKNNNWNFVDTYNSMIDKMEEEGLSNKDILIDQSHPNSDGHAIWFEVIKENLDKKLVDI